MGLSMMVQAVGLFAVTNVDGILILSPGSVRRLLGVLPLALGLRAAWHVIREHRSRRTETSGAAEHGGPGTFEVASWYWWPCCAHSENSLPPDRCSRGRSAGGAMC